MYKDVTFRPGIYKDATDYANKGGWYDCDKVRFRNGWPESIGGWQKFYNSTYVGSARALNQWQALDGSQFIGIGTNLKLYIGYAGTNYDITPIRRTASLTNPFTVTNGSSVVTVTDTANGSIAKDFVTLTTGSDVGGITAAQLTGNFEITTIVDPNTYQFDCGHAATSNATGGGSVTASYEINTGLDNPINTPGWGAGGWGAGSWGIGSGSIVSTNIRLWDLQNYGQDLVAAIRNGAIYYWVRTHGLNTRAVLLSSLAGASDVPTIVTGMIVSSNDQRLIAYGCNAAGDTAQNTMLVRWTDAGSPTNWTADTATTAGDYQLTIGSQIVKGVQTRLEYLFFTDAALYSMRFVGGQYTYGFNLIANNISIIAPNTVAVSNSVTAWMGYDNFYVYTGDVEAAPCTLRDYVFNTINTLEVQKFFAAVNRRFNEIWWFYCSGDSTEINAYVIWNVGDGTWSNGTLERTAWSDALLTPYPLAADGGYLYQHEYGTDADGASLASYVQSSQFPIDDGDHFTFVRRIIPDVTFRGTGKTQSGQYSLLYTNGPQLSLTTAGPYDVTTAGTGTYYCATAVRARDVALKWSAGTVGTSWRLGATRLDIRPDGRA